MSATAVARQSGQAGATSAWLPYAVVFMRLAFGLWLLWHEAIDKWVAWTPKTLPGIFTSFSKVPGAYPFYVAFLKNVAIPNAGFFAVLVPTWETVFASGFQTRNGSRTA